MSRPVIVKVHDVNASDHRAAQIRVWLDMPDVDRSDMVIPFIPTRERITEEQVKAITTAPPFDTLPRSLVPSSRCKLRPPMLHCGWEVNASLLLSYAKAKNIPVLQEGPVFDEYEYDSEEDSEDFEWRMRDRSNRTIDDLDPHRDSVAYHALLNDALLGLIHEVAPDWPEDMSAIKRCLNAGTPLLMSLFTSYDLRKAPSLETAEAIGRKLEQTSPPKWYLDMNHWKWRRMDGGPLHC